MKILVKLITASFATLFFIALGWLAFDVSAFGVGKSVYSYLILGLDDAASNSDSILLVSYDSSDNTASVIQLPRDTYSASAPGAKKINSVYAAYKASGSSDRASAEKTADFIAERLGVKFDGYLAFCVSDLISLVDALGGVRMDLPEDVVFYGKDGSIIRSFRAGKNVLNGTDAAFFVRHRAGYANGDLGRLDAQKIFMKALFETALHNVGIDELFDISRAFSDSAVTNIRVRDVLSMVLKHSSKFRDAAVSYVTMPGKALRAGNGVWYYALNRNGAIEVLKKYMKSDGDSFDLSEDFINKNDSRFSKIYFSESGELN